MSEIKIQTNRAVYEDLATKSQEPNNDAMPSNNSQVDAARVHQKINKEFYQVDNKHNQAKVASVKAKTSHINTSQLPSVAESIAFFEGLNKKGDSIFGKPVLPQPKLMSMPVPTSELKSEPMSTPAPIASAVAATQPTIAEVLAKIAAQATLLDTIQDFFDKWVAQPFRQFFGLEEIVMDMEIKPLSSYASAKFAEYMERLEKELNQIQERSKEVQEQTLDIKSRLVVLRLQWIRLMKAQIQRQEQQMEILTEMVTQKQLLIQERQKEHCKAIQLANDKDAQIKPLEWISTGASAVQGVTACLAGATALASLVAFGSTLGILGAVSLAVNGSLAVAGGLASAVKGGVDWRKAGLTHDLDKLIGQLQAWRHADECDTQAIEEELKELSLKLESVKRLWEDLIYSAQMQHQVARLTLR